MKFKMNVLSPIHIGAEQIGLSDFVSHGGHIYVVDERRLAKVLRELNLVSNFVSWCDMEQRPDIVKFLSERRILRSQILEKVSSRRIPIEGKFKGNRVLLNVFDPVAAKPIIPGSSVKGAIRTAVISSLIKSDSHALSGIRQTVRRRPKKESAGDFLEDVLRKGSLSDARRGPHNDWLRCLLVGDASPVRVSSGLLPVKVLSLTKSGRALPKTFTIWVEAILPTSSFDIDISIDKTTLGLISGEPPFKDYNHLMDILKEHVSRLVKEDVAFFERTGHQGLAKASRNIGNHANLRVGWGGGWISTTVGSVLDDGLRCDVRRAYYKSREGFPFPKYRRVWVDSQERLKGSLGWVQLQAGGTGN